MGGPKANERERRKSMFTLRVGLRCRSIGNQESGKSANEALRTSGNIVNISKRNGIRGTFWMHQALHETFSEFPSLPSMKRTNAPFKPFFYYARAAGFSVFVMIYQQCNTPGIHPRIDRHMLMKKSAPQPRLRKTGTGGRKRPRK